VPPAVAPVAAPAPPAAPPAAPTAPTTSDQALPRPGPDGVTLVLEGLLNGGFELLADGTTSPPKYGAYWVGAFSFEPDDPSDRIEHGDDAAEGRAWLALAPDGPGVHQKLVADPRWTERIALTLAWRAPDAAHSDARLVVQLEDGPGRLLRVLAPADAAPDANGWRWVELPLGAAFSSRHGGRPQPRLNLRLSAEGGPVDVDAASLAVSLPRVRPADARTLIEDLVRRTLMTWTAPVDGARPALVERSTGYVLATALDVTSGGDVQLKPIRHLHSLHEILARWIAYLDATDRHAEAEPWRELLRRFVTSLLDQHFDPDSGLPRILHVDRGPFPNSPVTVGAFVEFLMEVRPLLDDPALVARCETQVRRTGDALLALQARHDLDPDEHPNAVKLDRASGRFIGQHDNWFGHMPNRLTPRGAIDPPKQYNTSWAIVTGRSFWYHLLKSPAAVMAAHAVEPKDGDLQGIARALSRYQRPWDATRYDLENDTDDHYGYLSEDLATLLSHGGAVLPDALRLLQTATDHRLSRDTGRAGDTLWIQAIRLGSSCAGDSPRAFKGLLDLYELPPEQNPVSSGLPLYREALLELAANDFKGRQLTNGQFTESFFSRWEMVCICFKGKYQGDCREREPDAWDGDVGDIFGGPPLQSINAQAWALRVAQSEDERAEILARLGSIYYVSETGLRAPHGYLSGLDPAVARQYELPPKYATGLDPRTAAGLGYVNAWLSLLPYLDDDE